MKTNRKLLITLIIALLVALTACAPKAAEPAAPACAGGFKISGLVNAEQTFSLDQLKGMEAKKASSTNKEGKTIEYTGVSLAKLFEAAGIKPEAKTLIFTGSDGYTKEVTLAEVQACADCILAIQEDGSFINIMPGLPGNTQVRWLVEIVVK